MIPVNGIINALTISVTHPATVSYSIEPNADAGYIFIAPDIQITNNTKVPIIVALNSLASSAGGTIQFTDMDPTTQIDWDNMGIVESKEYIALGLTLKDEMEWIFAGLLLITHLIWVVHLVF